MIVGTAGHVNHGKTTLVEALTGVNCDRLDSERARGMTIVLGFAPWKLPDGRELSIIDVPGHARFARTMAAGALGIDLALLVVAADEGFMPQTWEHVATCEVLGIERAVVAMNRTDRVDDVEAASARIRESLERTVFAGAPIVPVCAPLFEGLEELTAKVAEALGDVDEGPAGPAVMPVDRAFSVKGFGTVVTGSLLRGEIAVGDRLFLEPGHREARVRTLHVHDREVDRAVARTRLAINLADARVADAPRGTVLGAPGGQVTSRMLDVELRWLAHHEEPLKRITSVGLVSGPARAQARVQADAPIAPGTAGTARIRLDRPIAAFGGMRFVLRGKGDRERGAVIGGGRVIDAKPPRRRAAEVRTQLADTPDIDVLLEEAGVRGLAIKEVGARLGVAPLEGTGRRFSEAALTEATDAIVERVRGFLAEHSDVDGMPREQAQARAIDAPALERAIADERLVREGNEVRTPEHVGPRAAADAANAERLLKWLEGRALDAPREPELAGAISVDEAAAARALALLDGRDAVVRAQGFCFAASAAHPVRVAAAKALLEAKSLPFGWLKDAYGLSRKHAMPLWTWLDRQGVSVRRGDARAPGPGAKRWATD